MKKGYTDHIETLTKENTDFRRVLYTGAHIQLVLMALRPGEEIGLEVHEDTDQFFRFEAGEGVVHIDGVDHIVKDGDTTIVPEGASHNIINTSTTDYLKLYTIYTPPHHKDGTVHATRIDAESHEEHFDGVTTE
ncbi:cupin domain-containing protein [Patescibacteria group bacterium]|jgi:mannose-6-phosphate isomerase-like protein (cupin superfamily)|nr:cupin domain-containing protein [Patescibacteria group bacterium]